MPTVLITGGSGMIGSRLTQLLQRRGYGVVHLERSKKESTAKVFTWDIQNGKIETGALVGVDAVIHLAGAGIADKRWTSARKREILESRTKSTQLLYNELRKGNHTVKTFLCASAIGFYGAECDGRPLTELGAPGSDFLAHVTQRWENEAEKIATLGIRVLTIRTGIVLSTQGGALPKLQMPVKLFVGAPLGSGNQYMSWIHIDDHCGILIKGLEDERLNGAYNSVAPKPVTNRVFTKTLGKALHRPILLPPIPSFVLRVILGELSITVTTGCNVSSAKIREAGYQFLFNDIDAAFAEIIVT